MSSDLISLQEAAELIGKNLRTIQRYIKNGKLSRHDENDKNFVSKKEVEEKFGVLKAEKAEIKKEPVAEKENRVPAPSEKTSDFQAKWVEEIQNHAETREELGVWKGRAEAYQAFAGRLLGDGTTVPADISNIKKDDSTVSSANKYLLYIIIGVLFIALVVLAILVRFWIIG